ncbi:MAG: 30S ribosomal protein S7, partial [Candidatus Omnitrophica bacterium]|nr:30S ribosomal protein S7 [Candidatus Omnitrophota bacterium]
RRTGRSASRFLMPFSYAAVFGGVITIIGTSTNVTVSGLLRDAGKEPLEVFKQALDNVRPLLETKSRRVGGATYQVPVTVGHERGCSLAMRWIRGFAKSRKGKPMNVKLAEELLDCYNKTGSTMKKREDVHKMAESNRAFAHYRW